MESSKEDTTSIKEEINMKKITTIESKENFELMTNAINYIMNLKELNEEVFAELQGIEEEGFYCPITEEVFATVPFEERWYTKYYPTYHMSVLLVKYYLEGHKEVEEQLLKTLDACLSKEYKGHGYDVDTCRLRYLTDLYKAGLEKVTDKFKMLACEFGKIVCFYRNCLATGRVQSGFDNIEEAIMNLLEVIDKDVLFVYGTLLDGEPNAHYLDDCPIYGEGEVRGYALLQLNGYPGMVKGDGIVAGELYSINDSVKKRIDRLEGSQYKYSTDLVYVGELCFLAHFYEYIPFEGKKYNKAITKDNKWVNVRDYVWYACYGSNLLSSRFDEYIQNTTSKAQPVESKPIILPYELYFAKQSSRWDHKGVAFIDSEKSGHTYGWMYLITREQYEQIKAREGGWYRRKVHVAYDDMGIEIVTFTSTEKYEEQLPGERYLDVIRRGLKEKYFLNDELMETYLNKAMHLSNKK